MPVPSPFHEQTRAQCQSYRWKDWAGFYAVCSYVPNADHEYFVFRHAAGVIDVSPLFKYDVRGKDAGRFLAYTLVKDVQKLKPMQVTYTCFCTDSGHVVDDGTVTRMGEDYFRVTTALPSFSWFGRIASRFDVTIEDVSGKVAALSVQGPNSRLVVNAASGGAAENLKFFYGTRGKIGGSDVVITRTGYTGDLGYEIWSDIDAAGNVWNTIMVEGKVYQVAPAGLDAMDMTRIEAGFILNGVDYFSAPLCLTDARKSTPSELNLGKMVQLKRGPFMGQGALAEEAERGPAKSFVGLVVDWDEFEEAFRRHGLPPEVPSHAWRTGVPVYSETGIFIGQATSGTWSPQLKKNLALATVQAPFANEGTIVKFEITVEYRREVVSAVVTKLPFYDPERKRL